MTNNGPVGASVIGGGSITIGTLTQNVNNVSTLSMPKEADAAFKRRQEMACSESMILFSEPSFLESLLSASHSTISFFSETHKVVYGTGYVIPGGYVATAMHNICPGKDYKRDLLKSINNDKWRTEVVLNEGQKATLEQWRASFAVDVHLFVDYSSKSDLEQKRKELEKNKLHFDASKIILFPHHDVMLIKISGSNCPPPLNLLYPEVPLATGDTGPQSRCFLIGHPSIKLEDNAERNLNMAKVISMQRDNFIWRQNTAFSTVEYFTDTLPGFSGGPVLIWRDRKLYVIAVHFSGIDAPRAKALAAEVKKELLGYNEGTLLSAILNKLKKEGNPAFEEITGHPL